MTNHITRADAYCRLLSGGVPPEEARRLSDDLHDAVEALAARLALDPFRVYVGYLQALSEEGAPYFTLGAASSMDAFAGTQRAYHGSPYAFETFDRRALQSGEGANAYGAGFYFTRDKSLARAYSGEDGVAGASVPALFEINGEPTSRGTPEQKAADLIHGIGLQRARRLAEEMFKEASAGEEWTQRLGVQYYERVLEITRQVTSARQVRKREGHIYEVEIPGDENLLAWDRPLDEQPAAVQERLQVLDALLEGNPSGSVIYKRLARRLGNLPSGSVRPQDAQAASVALSAIGIPGVRYLPSSVQMNRVGQPNYVVWEPCAIRLRAIDDHPVAPATPPDGGASREEAITRLFTLTVQHLEQVVESTRQDPASEHEAQQWAAEFLDGRRPMSQVAASPVRRQVPR